MTRAFEEEDDDDLRERRHEGRGRRGFFCGRRR